VRKEYKSLPFSIESKQVNDIDGQKTGVLKGYFASFSRDRGDDIILPGAFRKTIQEHKRRSDRRVRVYFQHNPLIVLGGAPIDSVFEDDFGLFGTVELNLETQDGREKYSQALAGNINDFSIGFMPREVDFYEDANGETVRKLLDIELFEVSLVTEPMNIDALVTQIKRYQHLLSTGQGISNIMANIKNVDKKTVTAFEDYPLADRDREWDAEAANARWREFTNSSESPSDSYRRGFMWYNQQDADEYGAYKLQYVDVIDGVVVAVPRAIFAIAGALDGARGGVDLPGQDIAAVKNHVERYYEKMGLEAPFKNPMNDANDKKMLITNNMLFDDSFGKRDFEKVLRDSGLFSKSASVTLASALGSIRADSNVHNVNDINAGHDVLCSQIQELTKLIKTKW